MTDTASESVYGSSPAPPRLFAVAGFYFLLVVVGHFASIGGNGSIGSNGSNGSIIPFAVAQETILLWPDGAPDSSGLSGPEVRDRCVGNITEPSLTVYHPDSTDAIGAAVLVIPGGGYSVVCLDHEGTALAEWLTGVGFTVGVLKYRLPNGRHEVPFQDAQQAIRLMRSRAGAWIVAPDRIGVLGFSAGGHLASTVGTRFTEDFSSGEGDHLDLSHRPDFMVLVYPVITMMDDYTHRGSQRELLGENPEEQQLERFSNHVRVTEETPPTFLVHSSDDEVVHPFNSTAFYMALVENGVSSELHLFERGGHGYALSEESPAREWDALAETWLTRIVGVD